MKNYVTNEEFINVMSRIDFEKEFPSCCFTASNKFLEMFGKPGDKLIEGIYSEIGAEGLKGGCSDCEGLHDCTTCGGDANQCYRHRHYWVERENQIIDLTGYQFTERFLISFTGREAKTKEFLEFLNSCNGSPNLEKENYIPVKECMTLR